MAFLSDMTTTFHYWLKSKDISDFDSLKELMLMENFLWKIEPHVANHLKDKEVGKLSEAASLPDDYVLNLKFRSKKPYDKPD